MYVDGRNKEAVTERAERFVRDVEKDGFTVLRLRSMPS